MTMTIKLVPGHKCDVAPVAILSANTVKVGDEEYAFDTSIAEYAIDESRDCSISSASRDPVTGALTVAVKRFFRAPECWVVTFPDGTQAGGMGPEVDEVAYDFH